ncbi:hypothetical protein GF389_03535 [Candidatus Dojkabacteria bacterium]|nr:hypothetical protein [Candidatus Dojkabacteria bacterium]
MTDKENPTPETIFTPEEKRRGSLLAHIVEIYLQRHNTGELGQLTTEEALREDIQYLNFCVSSILNALPLSDYLGPENLDTQIDFNKHLALSAINMCQDLKTYTEEEGMKLDAQYDSFVELRISEENKVHELINQGLNWEQIGIDPSDFQTRMTNIPNQSWQEKLSCYFEGLLKKRPNFNNKLESLVYKCIAQLLEEGRIVHSESCASNVMKYFGKTSPIQGQLPDSHYTYSMEAYDRIGQKFDYDKMLEIVKSIGIIIPDLNKNIAKLPSDEMLTNNFITDPSTYVSDELRNIHIQIVQNYIEKTISQFESTLANLSTEYHTLKSDRRNQNIEDYHIAIAEIAVRISSNVNDRLLALLNQERPRTRFFNLSIFNPDPRELTKQLLKNTPREDTDYLKSIASINYILIPHQLARLTSKISEGLGNYSGVTNQIDLTISQKHYGGTSTLEAIQENNLEEYARLFRHEIMHHYLETVPYFDPRVIEGIYNMVALDFVQARKTFFSLDISEYDIDSLVLKYYEAKGGNNRSRRNHDPEPQEIARVILQENLCELWRHANAPELENLLRGNNLHGHALIRDYLLGGIDNDTFLEGAQNLIGEYKKKLDRQIVQA